MSLRVRVLSDLHNEISLFAPPAADADVVILAGDIDVGTKGIACAAETFDCPVLGCPGWGFALSMHNSQHQRAQAGAVLAANAGHYRWRPLLPAALYDHSPGRHVVRAIAGV